MKMPTIVGIFIFISREILYSAEEHDLIVLGFKDMSTLVDHFESSPTEREKRKDIV